MNTLPINTMILIVKILIVNRLTLGAILAAFFVSLPLFSKENSDCPYPQGKQIDGELQFDSLLALNSPLSYTKSILIVRYYVSEDAIAYDLLWAEPAWTSMNYPYPPFDISCSIDRSDFRLYAAPHKKSWNHDMKDSSRGVFTHLMNSYAIEDQRFAYAESMATRLNRKSYYDQCMGSGVREIPDEENSNYWKSCEFSPNQINISRKEKYGQNKNSCIVSKKQINYFDEGEGTIRTEIRMPEYLVPVSGFSVDVTDTNKNDYKFTSFPAAYHYGDRRATVVYQKLETSPSPVLLPSRVSVYSEAEPAKLLRSAKLYNFTKIPHGTVAHKKASPTTFDIEFEQLDVTYRKLSVKYWYTAPSLVPEEDLKWLTGYAKECLDKINTMEDRLSTLKYINRFTLAQMLSGHDDQVVDIGIPQYLSVMNNVDLNEVGLLGISDLIQLFVDRNEKDLLMRLFSSERVARLCMEYTPESMRESLTTYPALALLLNKCADDQADIIHSLDDVFLMRYLIATTLGETLGSYKTKQIHEKPLEPLNLLLMLDLDTQSLSEICQRQKRLAIESYHKIAHPMPQQQQMYAFLLNLDCQGDVTQH